MAYLDLLGTLDAWFEQGVRAAGRRADGTPVVPCRGGCNACCRGVFDLSPADAAVLGAGVAALPDPVRRPLLARAEAQAARYTDLAPDWAPPFDVEALGEDRFDALIEPLADEPCPALDGAGACVLYHHRPATCRMLGLGLSSPELGVLENECPIQAEHPDYAALPPTPFDLVSFERASVFEEHTAAGAGWVTTTVAGAILAAARSEPRA